MLGISSTPVQSNRLIRQSMARSWTYNLINILKFLNDEEINVFQKFMATRHHDMHDTMVYNRYNGTHDAHDTMMYI